MINTPLEYNLQLPFITPPENRAGNVSDTEHPVFLGEVWLKDATHVKLTSLWQMLLVGTKTPGK